MKWVICIFVLLSGCGIKTPKKDLSESKLDTLIIVETDYKFYSYQERDTLIVVDSEYKFYSYEERDTLHVPNFYGKESYVLLGEIIVDSVNYDLYTVCRKAAVCDGFHYTSFLLFRNESEEIRYVVLNDDIRGFVDVYQNKIVVKKENGLTCFEKFESFADEMVFECIDGLLQR